MFCSLSATCILFHKTRVILGIADSALRFADALYATSVHELPIPIVLFFFSILIYFLVHFLLF